MSNAHEAYLADWEKQHPDIIEPECLVSRPDMTNAQSIYGYRVWDSRSKCFELADGRILEIGVTTNFMNCYAVFPNRKAWNSYVQPMSFNQYWNG